MICDDGTTKRNKRNLDFGKYTYKTYEGNIFGFELDILEFDLKVFSFDLKFLDLI